MPYQRYGGAVSVSHRGREARRAPTLIVVDIPTQLAQTANIRSTSGLPRDIYRSWLHLVYTLRVSVRGGASSEASVGAA